MKNLSELILSVSAEWKVPRLAVHSGEVQPLPLRCRFRLLEHDCVLRDGLPPVLEEFWSVCEEAWLFEDAEFGQWGLHIFNVDDALSATQEFFAERSRDSHPGDLIIGEFKGDSDMLLIRTNAGESDSGHVIVVNAIDPRAEWDCVADNFLAFLNEYIYSEGEKYWERRC